MQAHVFYADSPYELHRDLTAWLKEDPAITVTVATQSSHPIHGIANQVINAQIVLTVFYKRAGEDKDLTAY